jgi:predicted nucleic acid-binding Zn finger protein
MKTMMSLIAGIFLFTISMAFGVAKGVDIHSLKDWDIVVAADAIESEIYAAEEFQKFYEQASGIKLQINKTSERKDHHVFIGVCQMMQKSNVGFKTAKFGYEDFRIIVRENNISIAGGRPRGTLYGVYTFLEDYLGVRFLTPDDTYVPKLGESKVIANVDRFYHPPLAYRFTNYAGTEYNPEFAVRMRANHHDHGAKYGGQSEITLANHTFYQVMPTSKYGKEHPEYYSMIDGNRKSEVKEEWYETQLCLTNPDVLKIITDDVLEQLKNNPGLKDVIVGQNDSLIDVNNYCQCPKCAAIDKREGSPSGSLIAFVNAVADEVAKSYPDVTVCTLAYHHTRKAPRTIKPRANVRIQLCAIECCVMHSINDANCPKNAEFCKDLAEWSKICKNISIWYYNSSFVDCRIPCPSLRVIGPNIRYSVAKNVNGIFMEGTPYDTAGYSELRTYITMNLLWNPNRDGEQLMNEFATLYYGKAAQIVLDYINMVHDNAKKLNLHQHCCGAVEGFGINESIGKAGLDAFAKAMSLADNDIIRARLEKLSIMAYRASIEPVWNIQDKAELEKMDVQKIENMRSLTKKFFELCDKYEKRPFEEGFADNKKRLTELLNL